MNKNLKDPEFLFWTSGVTRGPEKKILVLHHMFWNLISCKDLSVKHIQICHLEARNWIGKSQYITPTRHSRNFNLFSHRSIREIKRADVKKKKILCILHLFSKVHDPQKLHLKLTIESYIFISRERMHWTKMKKPLTQAYILRVNCQENLICKAFLHSEIRFTPGGEGGFKKIIQPYVLKFTNQQKFTYKALADHKIGLCFGRGKGAQLKKFCIPIPILLESSALINSSAKAW